MATDDIEKLRDYYDSHDTSAELEMAEPDDSVVDEPMVGITIRLPAAALNAAREAARLRGVKVTALLREWIEQNLGDEAGDDRLVSVRDLKSFIAQKSQASGDRSEAKPSRAKTQGKYPDRTAGSGSAVKQSTRSVGG